MNSLAEPLEALQVQTEYTTRLRQAFEAERTAEALAAHEAARQTLKTMHANVTQLRAERDRAMRELHERHPHGRKDR